MISKTGPAVSDAPAVLPLEAADLDELVRLHSEYLNYGDGIRPHFEETLADPSVIGLKAVAGGEIAGILIYTQGISLSGGHEDLCSDIRRRTHGELVYTGDAVVVRSEYRGHHLSA
jgi:hypothetical protein